MDGLLGERMPMSVKEFDFAECHQMSSGIAVNADVQQVLLDCLPGSLNAYPAAPANDRIGIDWWVEMPNGKHFAIDVKVRKEDWAATHPNEDDLALETWSVVENRKIGWTRDTFKRCDYVLWLWVDTKRYCLIPFPMLCKVFATNWREWSQRFKVKQQKTRGLGPDYHSECVFVPRHLIWAEIYRNFGGQLPNRGNR